MRSCPRCRSIYSAQIEFCGLDGTQLVEGDEDPLIGLVIDRYQIDERLGEGGMASVYRARHTTIDREYAVKLLHGEIAADKTFAERFRREAQAVSKINHPNVVSVSDYGSTPEGLTFLVMEMLRGRTLRDAIKEDGPFTPARAAGLVRQIAAGLAGAHKLGFVHRDLKPSNVMLIDQDGREVAKILDFGLVAVTHREEGDEKGRLTQTGNTMGTPYYMAPEQIRGETATVQTDLYALGTVLFEMLSGRPPFSGQMTEVLFKHAIEPAPELPPAGGLERLVKKLLEKEPAARPASAEALIAEIDRLVPGEAGAQPRPVSGAAPVPTPTGGVAAAQSLVIPLPGRKVVLGVIGGVVAAALALGLVLAMSGTEGDVVVADNAGVAKPAEAAPAPSAPSGAVEPPVAKEPVPVAKEPTPVAKEPTPAKEPPPAKQPPPAKEPRDPSKHDKSAHALAQLDASVDDALRKRGLALDDLASQDSGAHAVKRWREARRGASAKEATAAGEAVLAEVARIKIDGRFLRKKLDRIEEAMKSVPADKLPSFESRYLDLSGAALRRGLDEGDYADLSKRISNLLREVNAAQTH